MVAVSLRIMPPLAASGPHNASNGPAPLATTLSPFYGHPVKLISWHQSELTPLALAPPIQRSMQG